MTDVAAPAFEQFAIGFDKRDRDRLHELWDEVIDSGQWSHGPMNAAFESAWSAHNGAGAVAVNGWAGGALAALDFADVAGKPVLCPSNTFMATPLAILRAGGQPVFVDCRRDDLCLGFEAFEEAAERVNPAAAVLVHIGGHLAFDSERIARVLPGRAGSSCWRTARTRTAPSGTARGPAPTATQACTPSTPPRRSPPAKVGCSCPPVTTCSTHARAFRDYGKPDYAVEGLNFRMSEFTAALALVQTERLPEIVAWKNTIAREVLDPRHPDRLELPDGMTSGLLQVHRLRRRSSARPARSTTSRAIASWGRGDDLPNTDWVAENHWCAPLYYRPEEDR